MLEFFFSYNFLKGAENISMYYLADYYGTLLIPFPVMWF